MTKIAILGGGIAGLTAAYELTKTAELRGQHEVTVYQMGWRLGGKAASGRDPKGRNLEHGLHVWFGCYENVFRLAREIYEARAATIPPECPLKHWTDIAKPQTYTPIGVEVSAGQFEYYPLEWPIRNGIPGDGQEVVWSPRDALRAIGDFTARAVLDVARDHAKMRANDFIADAAPSARQAPPLPEAFGRIARNSSTLDSADRARAQSLWRGSQGAAPSFDNYAEAARLWTRHLIAGEAPIDADSVEEIATLYWKAEQQLVDSTRGARSDAFTDMTRTPIALKLRLLREMLHILAAMTRGYLLDLLLPDAPFESLDGVDLRKWLEHHGADPALLARSSLLRIVYDTLFQYEDGDVEHPSYAAGTALGVIARLTLTYKNAMMWDIQAGMGEALIAPMYEVLRDRGVKFSFFHKATKLELGDDARTIQRVRLKVQARAKDGTEYQPLKEHPTLKFKYWPDTPDWDQLHKEPAWRGKRPDFESHWLDGPQIAETVLERGTDFDIVVLAVSMGAYKPLNDEPGMCAELIAEGGAFADFVNKIGIVPTQSLQLWCDRTLAELGWESGKPATVSGPQYLNIWADMTQVLAFEDWPAGQRPKSLHYLCGTLKTDAYRQPAANTGVPAAVDTQLRNEQIAWLNARSAAIWPAAQGSTGFDFSVVTDPGNRADAERFKAQYSRANVSPTDCCVLSSAGTTRYRLLPGETGFENLVLAGEATRHGFNTTAIEGAAMSGMAASWTICGSPAAIPGFDFLQRRPSERERPLAVSVSDPSLQLPDYLSFVGRGAACIAPPARFTGAKAFAFVASASTTAMQALVDTYLTRTARGAVKYQASAPWAFLSFLDIEQCTSAADMVGWVPGRECAIWVPLLEVKQGSLPRPVLWSPYIFIDYTIGLVSGREIWGWNKTHAEIGMSREVGDAKHFSCKTTVFKTLAATTRGEMQTLYSISRDGTAPTDGHGMLGRARDVVRGAAGVLAWATTPFVSAFGLPLLSAVALKQVRDSARPDLACYQAIVNSPVRVTRFRGAGLLSDKFTLSVGSFASHRIAEDIFGRPSTGGATTVPVQYAAWAEFDFEALPGDVIAPSAAAS